MHIVKSTYRLLKTDADFCLRISERFEQRVLHDKGFNRIKPLDFALKPTEFTPLFMMRLYRYPPLRPSPPPLVDVVRSKGSPVSPAPTENLNPPVQNGISSRRRLNRPHRWSCSAMLKFERDANDIEDSDSRVSIIFCRMCELWINLG